MEKRSEKTYELFFAIPIIIGVFIRVLFYSNGIPFWNDESALALNIVNKSFLGLWGQLDYAQVSPPLFNCLVKFFGLFKNIFVFSNFKIEYFYRLPSLICSLASIALFYKLLNKVVENKIGRVFCLTLFCLNYTLIAYSQLLKSYSSDVLISIAVLLSYFYIDFSKLKKTTLLLIGLGYAFVIWYSYTALFAIMSVAILLFIKNYKNLKDLIILFVPFCLSALIFYICKKSPEHNAYLHLYWAQGFLKHDFSNFVQIIIDLTKYFFRMFRNTWIINLLFVSGLFYNIKNIKKETSLILLLPLFVAFLMSYLSIYPFYNRVAIYFIPVYLLILGKVFDFKIFASKIPLIIFSIFLFFFVVLNSFFIDWHVVVKKHYYSETTPQLLKLAEEKMRPQDFLFVLSAVNYEMYKDTVDIKNVIIEKEELFDEKAYEEAFSKLQKGTTYYLLLTHSGDKKQDVEIIKKILENEKVTEIICDSNFNTLAVFTKK